MPRPIWSACSRLVGATFFLVVAIVLFPDPSARVHAAMLFAEPEVIVVELTQGGTTNIHLSLFTDSDWVEVQATTLSPWLDVGSSSVYAGSGIQGTGTLSVVFGAGSLASGTYTGSVVLNAEGALNVPVSIPCVMTVLPVPCVLFCYPEALQVTHVFGEDEAQSSLISVGNRGWSDMTFAVASDVPWIVPARPSGVVSGEAVEVELWYTNMPYGVFTGRVTVTSTDCQALGSPYVIPVVMRAGPPAPVARVSTNLVTAMTTQAGAPAQATFDVINDNPNNGSFPYSVTSMQAWLSAVPTNGVCQQGDEIFLTMDPTGLAPGLHGGTLVVRQEGTEREFIVSVDFSITPANRVIAHDGPWTATVPVGAVVTQQFRVWNAGTGALWYSFSDVPAWLSLQPTGGQSSNNSVIVHQAIFAATNLMEGSHAANLRISGYAVNSPLDVPVSMEITARFEAEHPSYLLNAPVSEGPQSFPLRIQNAGSANQTGFQLNRFGHAFTLSATSGVSGGETIELQINVNPSGLEPGVHRGWVDVLGAGGFTHRLPVDVLVHPTNQLFEPALVFSRLEAGDWDIWTVRPDGTGCRPLVARTGDQTEPQFSPDGNYLLFRERTGGMTSTLVVYDLRNDAFTTMPDLLTPRWMANSRSIAGIADDPVTRSGQGSRVRVQPIEGGPAQTLWSSMVRLRLVGVDPLGRLTAIEQAADGIATRMIRRDAGGIARPDVLRSGPGLQDRHGSLSFDGENMVFEAAGETGEAVALLMVLDSGQAIQPLAAEAALPQRWPALSPGGDQLALVIPDGSGQSLITVSTKGAGQTNLLTVAEPTEIAGVHWGYMAQSLNTIKVSTQALFATATTRSTNTVSVSFSVAGVTNRTLHYGVTGGDTNFWHDKQGGGISTGQMDTVTLTAAPMNLAPGLHERRFLVVGHAANAPVEVVWTLEVLPLPSRLAAVAVQEALAFQNVTGTISRTMAIVRDGEEPAVWSLSANQPWVSFDIASGIATGDTSTVNLQFDQTGLPSGIHTAVVTMVQGQGSGAMTQVFQTTFTVLDVSGIDPPFIAVSTNSINISIPRYRNPTSIYIQAWNSGGNGIGGTNPLKYVIYKVNADQTRWLKLAPSTGTLTNRGERDLIRIDMDVKTFVSPSVSGRFWVHKEGNQNDREEVTVTVTFTEPTRHTLDAQNSSFITLHRVPPPGDDGKYAYDDLVRVWAEPAYGYTVREWTGSAQGSATQVTVRIAGDEWVFAYARQRTMLSGFVTNRLTGEPVIGAAVRLGIGGTVLTTQTLGGTFSPGAYVFEPPVGTATLSVEATGYIGRAGIRPTVLANQWNFHHLALDPVIFQHVDFFDWDPKTMIVRYTLGGGPASTYPVDMDVSFDSGVTWNPPNRYPAHVEGDVATNVTVGTSGQKFFWWHLADNYPYSNLSNVRVRVRSGEQSITSSVFAIRTGTAPNPSIYAYNTNTYGRGERRFKGAEVYIGGRTPDHLRGYTDGNGIFTWQGGSLYEGDTIFVRRKYHTRPSVREDHHFVDDVMYTVWMDSDVGNSSDNDYNSWDGVWRSFKVTRHHIDAVLRGDPIRVPLNRSLIEWNLTFNTTVSDLNDETTWLNLQRALAHASQYLYQITDGQMKLGKLYLAQQSMSEGDVRIVQGDDTANAMVDGIYSSPCCWTPRINMFYQELIDGKYLEWGCTLIHELGHYAFGFKDEYETDWYWGSKERMELLKAVYPGHYPENFGFMDGQNSITSMSSVNDYLRNHNDYTKLDPDNSVFEDYVTEHLYNVEEPCWTFFEKRFEGLIYVGNVVPEDITRTINILAQKSGYFDSGRSIMPDRKSSDYIPEPYNRCMIKRGDYDWFEVKNNHVFTNTPSGLPTTMALGRMAVLPLGTVEVLVVNDGRPCPGARVILQRQGSQQVVFGHTGPDGRRRVASTRVGDAILVQYRGTHMTKMLAEEHVGGELLFNLKESARTRDIGTLNESAPLTMLITGAFDGAEYVVTLKPGQTLVGPPSASVTFEQSFTTNPVVLFLGGSPAQYAVRISGYGDQPFTLTLHATSTVGQVFQTVDTVMPVPVYSDVEVDESLLTPSDALRQRETLGMMYCAFGPPPAPVAPTNRHVPPALHFALADGSALSAEAFAGLRLPYGSTLTAGVDDSGLTLLRWNAATSNWVATAHAVNPVAQTCSALLEQDGVYALFAPSTDDETAPSAITDLHAGLDPEYPARVLLSWTAPGDDGTNGTAAAYLLYMSDQPLTNLPNDLPSPSIMKFAPASAGSAESYAFDPPPETQWYIVIVARDEAGNYGPLSNIAVARPSRPLHAATGLPEQYLATMALLGYPDFDPDGDEDGDGLSNGEEFALNTNPLDADTDGDGMPDGFEHRYGLNPLDPSDAHTDLDGDGLSNREELLAGSDPTSYSSTSDGIADSWKLRYGLPILRAADPDEDADRDGFTTFQEFIADTHPGDDTSLLRLDGISYQDGQWHLHLNASTARQFVIEGIADLKNGATRVVAGPVAGQGEGSILTAPTTNRAETLTIKALLPTP